jgi:hypothetical protein
MSVAPSGANSAPPWSRPPLFPDDFGSGSIPETSWDEAPDRAVYVIPEEYRRRAQGPDGWVHANLRATLKKVFDAPVWMHGPDCGTQCEQVAKPTWRASFRWLS